ncbi:hypothetical protein BGZ76_005790 [Entomortierella beljakovae]|nr:hypothetical protein BGZ76_005790 [Entomortierella beljakovae]
MLMKLCVLQSADDDVYETHLEVRLRKNFFEGEGEGDTETGGLEMENWVFVEEGEDGGEDMDIKVDVVVDGFRYVGVILASGTSDCGILVFVTTGEELLIEDIVGDPEGEVCDKAVDDNMMSAKQ